MSKIEEILEKLNDKIKIDESIKIVETIRGASGIKRIPHNHINVLYLIKELMGGDCKNYLEIGTLWGASMATVLASQSPAKFYGLDLFTPYFADKIDVDTVNNTISNLNEYNHNIELIKGDCSHDEIIKLTYEKISDGVDLFFIDGDHSSNSVVRDFNNYKDIVNKGGYIVFDDYGFLDTVSNGVSRLDLSEFDIIGRINTGPSNSHLNESPTLNASYIIRKK